MHSGEGNEGLTNYKRREMQSKGGTLRRIMISKRVYNLTEGLGNPERKRTQVHCQEWVWSPSESISVYLFAFWFFCCYIPFHIWICLSTFILLCSVWWMCYSWIGFIVENIVYFQSSEGITAWISSGLNAVIYVHSLMYVL